MSPAAGAPRAARASCNSARVSNCAPIRRVPPDRCSFYALRLNLTDQRRPKIALDGAMSETCAGEGEGHGQLFRVPPASRA
jgi:hypothetical protein